MKKNNSDINPVHLLLKNEIQFDEIVSIRIPTVLEVVESDMYGMASYIFNVGSREIFTPYPNVDELEKRYPTVWELIFDEENDGDMALGKMLGIDLPASTLVMEAFEYWTGLDKFGFSKLLNGKIIHQESGWVVDKQKFTKFQEAIRRITNYQPNEDLIAPPNMTANRFRIWIKHREKRIERIKKQKGGTLADKILILQASFDSYISIEEIVSMSYFQFEKLYEALQEKESYLRTWEVYISPKFEADKNQKMKHWSTKINV